VQREPILVFFFTITQSFLIVDNYMSADNSTRGRHYCVFVFPWQKWLR